MLWLDDFVVLLLVVLAGSAYLLLSLFVKDQSTLALWEKLSIQNRLAAESKASLHSLDHSQLLHQLEQRQAADHRPTGNDKTTFVLSEYSLPVCRSLWRIVEYVLSDFVDFWWVKISDSPEFGNDLRDVCDHAFNVLGERCIKVDWSPFIVKNVISNLNYLMRIYRLTEQELLTHNAFFSNTPEPARHRLLKAELMRTYKLHVAVSDPRAYLRKLSTAVLSQILRSTDFRSETVRTMMRETLTTFVFMPVMKFVEPYWLNIGLINFLNMQQQEKDAAAAVAAAEPPTKRSSKPSHATTTFSQVGYSALMSPPRSRGSSPVRGGAFTMPVSRYGDMLLGEDDDSGLMLTESADDPFDQEDGVAADVDSADASSQAGGSQPRRKDTLLTQKMKEWEGEKAKRNEKKNSRLQQQQPNSSANAAQAHAHRLTVVGLPPQGSGDVRPHLASSPPDLPHDDEVPTGLLSPQGAFSHSPNHGTSPIGDAPAVPPLSQLTSNWEVRMIGAGIRFDPKPFVMYQLLVKNGDAHKWTVVKRYGKFEELHQKLKKTIPSFDAQLPKKAFFGNLDQQFIQNRKIELQTYLGQLLWNKNVQESPDLQQFLMPSADDAKWAQTTAGTTVAGSTGSGATNSLPQSSSFSFFGGKKTDETRTPPTGGQPVRQSPAAQPSAPREPPPPPFMHTVPAHQFSLLHHAAEPDSSIFQTAESPPTTASALNEVRSRVSSPRQRPVHTVDSLFAPPQLPTSSVSPPTSPQLKKPTFSRTYSADDITPAQPALPRALSSTPGTTRPLFSTGAATPSSSAVWEDRQLTDPLYHLVEEIFNLNGRGWVRRQATWVGKQIVKLTMDDLVKTKLTHAVDTMLNEARVTQQIDWVTDIIWPDGKLFEGAPPVSDEEKERVKKEALQLLIQSVPATLRTLMGKEHSAAALEKCFQFMQTEPLIQHFAFSVLDSLVLELFPDLTHVLGR